MTAPRWFYVAIAIAAIAAAGSFSYAQLVGRDNGRYAMFLENGQVRTLDTRTGLICGAGGGHVICIGLPASKMTTRPVLNDSL